MKLTGILKKEVDKAADISEKKSLIEKAGMLLSDDELEQVAGGGASSRSMVICPKCGEAVYSKDLEFHLSERCPIQLRSRSAEIL